MPKRKKLLTAKQKADAAKHGVAPGDYLSLRTLIRDIRSERKRKMMEVADTRLHHRTVKSLIEKYKPLIEKILKINNLTYAAGEYSPGSGIPFKLSGYGYAGYTPAAILWE